MTLIVPLGTETAGWTVTIDGRTYRPALLDSSGRLLVALDVTALKPFTTPANGRTTVTAAGTRVQLPGVACKIAIIKALPANTNNIYLGDSAVSSANGHVLDAGDDVKVPIDNLNRLYIDADTAGEGVSYLVLS